MGSEMAMRPLMLLPEMLLFGGGLVVLLTGSYLPRDRQWVARLIAVAALVASLAAAAADLAGTAGTAFEGTYAVDPATGVVRILAAVGTLLVLALASDEIAGSPRESDTYALLLFATTGTVVLAGADDLLVLAVAFLLGSIPLYGLVGLARTARGAEAAMKTYLMGALFGILLLTGVTVLYGVTGTTRYDELRDLLADAPAAAVAAGAVGVLAGLMFKAGGLPAHFWVPDAAQASTGTAAAFLTTIPKLGALVAAYRLVDALPGTVDWPVLVAVLAVGSMLLGNLAAYWQRDPRRLLGWSTVSQVGFLLVPVAVAGRTDLALPSLLLYLVGYTFTNLAAFGVTTALPGLRELRAFRGLSRARPLLALVLVVALLGLVGTPPTAVFAGKLTTATAAWDGGYAWLAVAALVNSVISLFYYLRWVAPAFRAPEPTDDTTPRGRFEPLPAPSAVAVVAAVLSLALGLAAGGVWSIADAPLVR
jgi:NADH-quinone oxidoreductase subunit N